MRTENEAQTIIEQYIAKFRNDGYEELLKHMQEGKVSDQVTAKSGVQYHMEVSFFFDNKSLKTIRVSGSVFAEKELGPWWKFWKNIDVSVANDSFIMAPDGSFVGE